MVSPGFPLADAGLTESVNGLGTTVSDEAPEATITGRPVTAGCTDVTGDDVGFCTGDTIRAGVVTGTTVEVSEGTARVVLPVVIISRGCAVSGITCVPTAGASDFPGPGAPEYVVTANTIRPVIRMPAKISRIRYFLSFGSSGDTMKIVLPGTLRQDSQILRGWINKNSCRPCIT
jgi:hypothetical protein